MEHHRKIIWLIGASLLIITIILMLLYRNNNILGHDQKQTSIKLNDVSKPASSKVTISLQHEQFVNKLKIKVQGSLNDTALLNQYKLYPGKIDTILYNHDWYQPEFEYKYNPYRADTGKLTVEFTFYYTN